MRICSVVIHNFRSIAHERIELPGFSMLVGANNAGKSNTINALRVFYEDLRWVKTDLPRFERGDSESWIELQFQLSEEEVATLPEKYQDDQGCLCIRKYLQSSVKTVSANQSNLYAVLNGNPEDNLFFGAKNIGQAKLGRVVYIPAVSYAQDSLKMTGPSPLRDVVTLLMKKASIGSAMTALSRAVEAFQTEAKKEDGFLRKIEGPVNREIKSWDIEFHLGVDGLSEDVIIKNLINYSLIERELDKTPISLDCLGHGFQRSLIYQLLRILPTLGDSPQSERKEFNPDFTLILFEEPEAFLHPQQQELLADSLRKLGGAKGQQVLISTHSPLFIGRAADALKQIIRLQKLDRMTRVFQLSQADLDSVLNAGNSFISYLGDVVRDPDTPADKRQRAQRLIDHSPPEAVAIEEDGFRYQLWLNSERSAMFFAQLVVIVEGESDKALLDYCLATEWTELKHKQLYVVDAIGKSNVHRCMALLGAFGIRHGVLLDADGGTNNHSLWNEYTETRCKNAYTAGVPYLFVDEMEAFMGIQVPPNTDGYKKPVIVLRALSNGAVAQDRIIELRQILMEHVLCITEVADEDSTNDQP